MLLSQARDSETAGQAGQAGWPAAGQAGQAGQAGWPAAGGAHEKEGGQRKTCPLPPPASS